MHRSPPVGGRKGVTRHLWRRAENFCVFSDAKHPTRRALDFLKFMLSKESEKSISRQLDRCRTVREFREGSADLRPHCKGAGGTCRSHDRLLRRRSRRGCI